MSRKIVLFNGPPGVGKDTVAQLVAARLPNSRIMKFAAPLKRATAALYCGGDRAAFDRLDSAEQKDEPLNEFFGLSCRGVQIALSERFLKPMHGTFVFGEILAADIEHTHEDHILVSDSGFRSEAEVLVHIFGSAAITLVRLHRAGCDFTGDSRGFIDLTSLGVRCIDVSNNEGSADRAAENVLAELGVVDLVEHAAAESMLQAIAGQGGAA